MEDRAAYSSSLGTSFDEMMVQMLRKDPAFREEYIRQSVEEGDPQALLDCLRHVVDAVGGIGALSKDIGLNRSQLYRTLSKEGRPEFSTVTKVLRWLGLHLTVERDRKKVTGVREPRKPYRAKVKNAKGK
jgi:probable addiction module antidote protein